MPRFVIAARAVMWGGMRAGMNDGTTMAREFVQFCFDRRPVSWPLLYDEMCNVAGRRLFRDMGYEELRQAGVDFTLGGLARMAHLAQEVTSRDRAREPAVS